MTAAGYRSVHSSCSICSRIAAGSGFVSASLDTTWLVPPIGRNVHVLAATDLSRSLSAIRAQITTCGFWGPADTKAALEAELPGARFSDIGMMQTPPFDGPADRRLSSG